MERPLGKRMEELNLLWAAWQMDVEIVCYALNHQALFNSWRTTWKLDKWQE